MTQWTVFGQMLPVGLVIGAMLAPTRDVDTQIVLLAVFASIGVALMLVWTVAVVVGTRRAQRRLVAALAVASDDLDRGRVTGLPAAARVIRSRAARGAHGHLAGWPRSPRAFVVVLEVLTPDGPRRVGALVPAGGLQRRGEPAGVLLHPTEREACLVDGRVDPATLSAIAADPRWASERLPTDRRVAGGYLPAVAYAVAGLVLGAGVPLSVGTVV